MADSAPYPLDAQEPTTSLPAELFDALADALAAALVASYLRDHGGGEQLAASHPDHLEGQA